MRFLMLVKHGENPGPPPQAFMAEMSKLAEQAAKDGSMIQSGGLAPLAKSTVVRVSRGKLTAIDGPFTEAKEFVGGFAMFELKSKEEAIEGARNFMELHRRYWPEWEGETEVRQIVGPEDVCSNK